MTKWGLDATFPGDINTGDDHVPFAGLKAA
jgi:hypothetical protein